MVYTYTYIVTHYKLTSQLPLASCPRQNPAFLRLPEGQSPVGAAVLLNHLGAEFLVVILATIRVCVLVYQAR